MITKTDSKVEAQSRNVVQQYINQKPEHTGRHLAWAILSIGEKNQFYGKIYVMAEALPRCSSVILEFDNTCHSGLVRNRSTTEEDVFSITNKTLCTDSKGLGGQKIHVEVTDS